MRRSASQIIRNLKMRIARLEKKANIERDFKNLLRQMKQIERSNLQIERYTKEIERDFDLRLSAKKQLTKAIVKEMYERYLDASAVKKAADKVFYSLSETISVMKTDTKEYRWKSDGSDLGSLSVSNPSLFKKIEAAFKQAKKQQEKAQANYDKLKSAHQKAENDLRVQKEKAQMKFYPKELTDEMKDWYKKIKKYLTDDNLRGARDIKKSVNTKAYNFSTKKHNKVEYTATMLFEGLELSIDYQEDEDDFRWYFIHRVKTPNTVGKSNVDKNINEAVKLFLDFTERKNWEGRKDLAPAQPKQKLMTPQIKQEIADKFQRVIKYFDGDKINIGENEIQAYTGDTGYYEAYDGDGAGEPVNARFERALNRYDKYIETISVDWYGDGEWNVTVYLKE